MAWHWPGDRPLSEPMKVNLLTHICVTQSQWVKAKSRKFNAARFIGHMPLLEPMTNLALGCEIKIQLYLERHGLSQQCKITIHLITVKSLITDAPNHQTWMFLVSSCSCPCPIQWSQVLSLEWRCSWSSADRWCSNYIWVIDNFIAY